MGVEGGATLVDDSVEWSSGMYSLVQVAYIVWFSGVRDVTHHSLVCDAGGATSEGTGWDREGGWMDAAGVGQQDFEQIIAMGLADEDDGFGDQVGCRVSLSNGRVREVRGSGELLAVVVAARGARPWLRLLSSSVYTRAACVRVYSRAGPLRG